MLCTKLHYDTSSCIGIYSYGTATYCEFSKLKRSYALTQAREHSPLALMRNAYFCRVTLITYEYPTHTRAKPPIQLHNGK